MPHDRRSVLAALGLSLPFGFAGRASAAAPGPAPLLRFRPFEDAVRDAFQSAGTTDGAGCGRRVEVGHSDGVLAGVQGSHNAAPFAGFPAGGLRIVRTGAGPGPAVTGVRLYVAWVEVAPAAAVLADAPGRPLDFATLPPAAVLDTDADAPPPAGTPRRRSARVV